jgi:phosphate transport system permease protein
MNINNLGLITRKDQLNYKPNIKRNLGNRLMTGLAALFSTVAVLPLILVLGYILLKGASKISISLFTELPPPPGLEGGGIGKCNHWNICGYIYCSIICNSCRRWGGIYLAEYSRSDWLAQFIRFGTNVLSGVPSIIAGVFIYGTLVTTRLIFGNAYSAVAGGLALSILMIPTVIKTTDEGLKLVPDDLRRGALGVGASRFITITRITLPAAFTPIATGVVLSIARAAGETAPLIFTALFSPYWADLLSVDGWFSSIATLSVLIYNFSIMPLEVQNELAWAASFVLVALILALNLFARWLGRFASR